MAQPNAEQQVAELIHVYWKSQAVYVAAKLGIADLLAVRPAALRALPRLPRPMRRRFTVC
jgi:hypothetical protein